MVENNTKEKYLGKSDGTTLWDHSVAVADMAVKMLRNSGIQNENILTATYIAGLIHDIGKTSSIFQEYLKKGKEDIILNIPHHNEVSFALLRSLADNEDFNLDMDLRECVIYSALFHHNPNQNSCTVDDLYNSDELSEICEYYNKMASAGGVGDKIHFNIEKSNIEEIGGTYTFDFIRGSINNGIKILGEYEIIFNAIRYADELVSGHNECDLSRPTWRVTDESLNLPQSFDEDKWAEQKEIVKNLYNEEGVSILDAVVGYGKTLCGIRYLLKSKKKGYWVCPDNSLANATYRSIIRTLSLCGIDDVKVSLVVSGHWEDSNYKEADIVVTNIDTYFNGLFRNSRKRISYECLFCNAIFDEFHEYAFMNSPLCAMFSTLYDIRNSMAYVKTLMMSGTPMGIGPKYNAIKENKTISPDNGKYSREKKVHIRFVTLDEMANIQRGFSDDGINYFTIYPKVSMAQDAYKDGRGDCCFHALFDDVTRAEIEENIFAHNGKEAMYNSFNLASTSIISRGFDISFDSVFLINPCILMIEQSIGRLWRWDNSKIGNVFIIKSEKKNAIGCYGEWERDVNGKTIPKGYFLWEKIYEPFIDYLQEKLGNDVTVSLDKIRSCREEFMAMHGNNLAAHNLKKSLKDIGSIEFRKGVAIREKGKKEQKHTSDLADVRGNTRTRFVRVQIEGEPFGILSDPIPIPEYKLGDDFKYLKSKGVVNGVIDYFKDKEEEAKKYFPDGNKSIGRYRNTDRLIEYLIYKAKNEDYAFPIMADFRYSKQIGFFKK